MRGVGPSLTVVVPVRDGGDLLEPCLRGVAAQLQYGDQLVVADDGSVDESPQVAQAVGATVLRSAGGPYAARNSGWREAATTAVVFTDVRCRPRAGWLESLRATLAGGAALACSEVLVPPGGTAAQRVMHRLQPFSLDRYVSHPFLPLYPTANLAVDRSLLEAVDGFAEMRSGGDADLCWRARLLQGVELAVAPGTGMDWLPRTQAADLMEQWSRYGRSGALLRAAYGPLGAPPDQGPSVSAATWRYTERWLRSALADDPPVSRLAARATLTMGTTHRRTWAELARQPDPVSWAWRQLLVPGASAPRLPVAA